MIFPEIIVSYLIALLLGFVLIPKLRELKIKQTERKEGPASHLKKTRTPTMGGLIFIGSFIVTIIIFSLVCFFQKIQNPFLNYIPMIGAAIGFGIIGFLDDYFKVVKKKGISAKAKMIGLFIISILFLLYRVFVDNCDTTILIPFTNNSFTLNKFFYILFNLLVLLGTTNAINLTDGVDGLASSVCIIIFITLTIIAQQRLISMQNISTIAIGSLIGYLAYNLYPAKVFMGDTGSLFLGGLVSLLAIYMNCPLSLLILAIIPIFETVSVMLQVSYFKITKGKRIFKMTPIHHHFEQCGWSENKIVIIFSLITILAGYITLLSMGINIFKVFMR